MKVWGEMCVIEGCIWGVKGGWIWGVMVLVELLMVVVLIVLR